MIKKGKLNEVRIAQHNIKGTIIFLDFFGVNKIGSVLALEHSQS